jgi:hypothetical protein
MTSPMQRSLRDKTQHSQETDIHANGGNWTRNPSKRAATGLRNLKYSDANWTYKTLRTTGRISPQTAMAVTRILYLSNDESMHQEYWLCVRSETLLILNDTGWQGACGEWDGTERNSLKSPCDDEPPTAKYTSVQDTGVFTFFALPNLQTKIDSTAIKFHLKMCPPYPITWDRNSPVDITVYRYADWYPFVAWDSGYPQLKYGLWSPSSFFSASWYSHSPAVKQPRSEDLLSQTNATELYFRGFCRFQSIHNLFLRGLLEKYPTVFCYANTWWIII